MKRLMEREKLRYGNKIDEGNIQYKNYIEFIDWAAKYDNGGLDVRSKKTHYNWLKKLECEVLRIEEDIEVEEKINKIKAIIERK